MSCTARLPAHPRARIAGVRLRSLPMHFRTDRQRHGDRWCAAVCVALRCVWCVHMYTERGSRVLAFALYHSRAGDTS